MRTPFKFLLKAGNQLAISTSLAFVLVSVTAAGELTYAGTWECDASPKINIPSFSAPASAVRDGDRLTVSRVVYRPGTFEEASRISGTGMVSNGRVAVEAASTGGGITARLSGTVSDREIALSGSEHVKLAGRGEDDRSCRVRLTRK